MNVSKRQLMVLSRREKRGDADSVQVKVVDAELKK